MALTSPLQSTGPNRGQANNKPGYMSRTTMPSGTLLWIIGATLLLIVAVFLWGAGETQAGSLTPPLWEQYADDAGLAGYWLDDDLAGATYAAQSDAVDEQEHVYCLGQLATLVGGPGDDVLVGTDGPDVILGRAGNDRINGKAGDDILCAGSGNNLIIGGAGDDYLLGGDGEDQLIGGSGQDFLRGDDADDLLIGQGGGDFLSGNQGNNILIGGSILPEEDDLLAQLFGFYRRDVLLGSTGDDILIGAKGDDALLSFGGNDILLGKEGNDSLIGHYGDDFLDGGAGAMDECNGSEGSDAAAGCEVLISIERGRHRSLPSP